MTQANYDILTDSKTTPAEKEEAFNALQRRKWLRGIVYDDGSYPPTVITDPLPTGVFVNRWWQVGIVTRAPGPPGPYPDVMWVETGRTIPEEGAAGAAPRGKMLLWDQDPTEMR
jgi:hypothetical protein